MEQVLSSRLRRRVAALHAFTVPVRRSGYGDAAGAGPTIEPELLTELAGACRDRERIRFGYHDHGGTESRRSAEPHRVVNWGRRWYLVAWDSDRRDWRTYRVDRISACTPTGLRAEPRELPDEDVARYVSQRVAAVPWRDRARVVVHAPADTVAARLPPGVGTVRPKSSPSTWA